MPRGLMQDRPLLVSSLIEHAARYHGAVEVVSRLGNEVHRSCYADVRRRAKQLANALTAIGVRAGDRIATLAWNDHRHLELYYGVSGVGAVLHTINPRLDPAEIEYMIGHAEDRFVFFDPAFLPLIEQLAPRLKVQGFVALASPEAMPDGSRVRPLCYEDLVAEYDADFDWPQFEECAASSLCYTSGTTGHPKGVLYSHRSTVLHSYATCTADVFGFSASDSALIVVPMFHVNAWGTPYSAAMCGAKLVLPGAKLDGASLYQLLRDEEVTVALGVPTVWLNLFAYVDEQGLDPARELRLRKVVIGGAAAPRSMIETFAEKYHAEALHAWGMTELSPLGTVCHLLPQYEKLDRAAQLAIRAKQGRPPFGVELRIVDDNGRVLPHDGTTPGHLQVRGPWVASAYYRSEQQAVTPEGFFDTGDIATLDAAGFMQITDRAKDLIKSGGEWISSIALEDAACAHPSVAEAAVIGVAHPKWQERPLMLVVVKGGQDLAPEELLTFLAARVPKWWLPDEVLCVEKLPRGATGKIQKSVLRAEYGPLADRGR